MPAGVPLLSFGTKAETLLSLQQHLSSARVLPLLVFECGRWLSEKESVLTRIRESFGGRLVVVRSSARSEDTGESSNAGHFTSVTGVSSDDEEALSEGIGRVLSSYPHSSWEEQFFVQPQLQSVVMSGVLFTRDIDTLAPYYVLNYDKSGSTISVTSGDDGELKTYVRSRHSPVKPVDHRIRKLLELAEELESLFQTDKLDIEFAFDSDLELYLFQVRPIVGGGVEGVVDDASVFLSIDRIFKKIQQREVPHPHLCGRRSMFSNMTDWNPAEIIGVRPRPLALSLYKELVTDSTWAYQRDNYGYRNLRSFPLLQVFMGFPYIDVRASFNSFVPKGLDKELSEKLVEYYLGQLGSTPSDHDKVEFKIIYSCYYLDLPRKVRKLLNFGFSELELDRIKFALLNLTNNIICGQDGLYLKDTAKVSLLLRKFDEIVHSDLCTLDKIYWLVEDCKRYGTLPFAGLARAGFIAVQFLRSFVELGIFTEDDFHCYMNSLNTVARQLSRDSVALREGGISKQKFLDKYGHLRPGTYDILSPCYKSAFDYYFPDSYSTPEQYEDSEFELTGAQRERIGRKLVENGILVEVEELMQFIQQAIEGREYSKFVFTRHLSAILELVADLGEDFNLTREELSFVDISVFSNAYSSVEYEDLGQRLQETAARNRNAYRVTEAIRLPQMITRAHDVYDFSLGEVEPNYITRSKTTSVVVVEDDLPRIDLRGKIVCIERADPGYDWLFSRDIAGLVTMYGGANSHMAIRCAELKIPAVIGCGEQNYKLWAASDILDIDCANRLVRIVTSRGRDR